MKTLRSLRLAGVALLAGAVLFGCGGSGPTGGPSGGNANTKAIGAIDQEELMKLDEFEKARKQLDDITKKTEDDLRKKWEGKPPSQQAQKEIQEARMEVTKKGNELMNPLKRRAEAAVAQVARNNKMVVVLDKRIVVYGVPDITADVKKAFQAPGEIKLPDETDTSKSPVGYFDQEVVRSLKAFQEAEMKIYRKRSELMAEFQKIVKQKNMPPQEQELLQREYRLKLETFQESVTAPLLASVNESVQEVAKAQGLSLVLDKQHVMQGGRNMTNEVVETFLKKVGGATAPRSSPTPKAQATPGAT